MASRSQPECAATPATAGAEPSALLAWANALEDKHRGKAWELHAQGKFHDGNYHLGAAHAYGAIGSKLGAAAASPAEGQPGPGKTNENNTSTTLRSE